MGKAKHRTDIEIAVIGCNNKVHNVKLGFSMQTLRGIRNNLVNQQRLLPPRRRKRRTM